MKEGAHSFLLGRPPHGEVENQISCSLCWHHSRRSGPHLKVKVLFRLGLLSSISSTRYAATCVLCCPWMRTTHIFSLSAPQTQLSSVVANVMWLNDWSDKSMHFVVQRQLTDVSDFKKNNLPQLLTSIHKPQLMHGASPRDFVTLLQTCKAIYKVVTNVIKSIFFQVEGEPVMCNLADEPKSEMIHYSGGSLPSSPVVLGNGRNSNAKGLYCAWNP